jgi:hypothetical protein
MEITHDAYGVTIKPDGYEKPWFKERFTLRIASKCLQCHECYGFMAKGDKYIRDKFWYEKWLKFEIIVVKKCNFICLKCWKGEIPAKISTNWMKD